MEDDDNTTRPHHERKERKGMRRAGGTDAPIMTATKTKRSNGFHTQTMMAFGVVSFSLSFFPSFLLLSLTRQRGEEARWCHKENGTSPRASPRPRPCPCATSASHSILFSQAPPAVPFPVLPLLNLFSPATPPPTHMQKTCDAQQLSTHPVPVLLPMLLRGLGRCSHPPGPGIRWERALWYV